LLRVAIVGAGWAGTRQAQAVRELGRKLTVTALADNDPAHLRATAGELGVSTVYTRYDDVLADADIDAVSICTPHDLHAPISVAAAEAGKHVLVEKPIAMTIEDATRMIAAAERNGVKLYVAENLCYTPMSRFLRLAVANGDHVGEITAISFTAGFRAQNFTYPGRRAWLTEPENGGTGTWMLHGIHSMAQARYIFGEFETVYLRADHAASYERPWLEGTMSGLFTLATGVHMTVLQTSETAMPHNLAGYTIYGDGGTLRASSKGYEVFDGGASPPEIVPYPASELSDYALEMEAFADTVAGVCEGATSGRSERRSLAVVLGGYESAATGQPVNLRERYGEL
jgi:predicted dehydrogenase